MGTIAARDARRTLELTEQVVAALSMACVQAVNLRGEMLPAALTPFKRWVEQHFATLLEDRPLQAELRVLSEQQQTLQLSRYWQQQSEA